MLVDTIASDVTEKNRETIVVDDGSPDGTADVVRQLQKTYPELRLIERQQAPSLVNSIAAGIEAANGEVIVWLDADLTMPPRCINDFLAEIHRGTDVVIGSRYIAGGGFKGMAGGGVKTRLSEVLSNIRDSEDSIVGISISKAGNVFARWILDHRYFDFTSGFYAVRREVFDIVKVKGYHLDYCIRFLIQTTRQGYSVVELPVTMVSRQHGDSKTTSGLFTLLKIIVSCAWVVLGLATRRI